MPVYEYVALTDKGKNITGIIDAEGAMAARQKLRSAGKFPTSIREVKEADRSKDKKELFSPRLFTRIRPSEIAIMTRQLSTLVGAGFPLVSAIDSLIPQTKRPALKKVIAQIKDSIVEGNSFAASLAPYPGTFSQLYINMVRAGESSGTLEIVLERLADITEKQQALKTRIRSAMAYPILMTFIGAVVLFLLLTFIVPNITTIFEDMHKALPAPTLFLIGLSQFMQTYWWTMFILLAGLVFGFRGFGKTEKGRRHIDKTILKLPLFGPLVQKLAVARFARTLGSLLENGVSMLQALDIVKNIAGNVIISEIIEQASEDVEKGQGLGKSLGKAEAFPILSVQMIEVGEQSGELEKMLIKMADVYENQVESSVTSMTSLLEPIMILVMGAIVGFIVLSICLPIFEMNQLVG
jgi:general secretion pathway protein F